jgi:hypothetical protein
MWAIRRIWTQFRILLTDFDINSQVSVVNSKLSRIFMADFMEYQAIEATANDVIEDNRCADEATQEQSFDARKRRIARLNIVIEEPCGEP